MGVTSGWGMRSMGVGHEGVAAWGDVGMGHGESGPPFPTLDTDRHVSIH